MKKLFTLFALLVAIVTGAQAETATFSMESKWGTAPYTKTDKDVTVTFYDGDINSNATQKGYIKFVRGATLTISTATGNITKIEITANSGKNSEDGAVISEPEGINHSVSNLTTTWEGSASSVTITNGYEYTEGEKTYKKGKDWQITSITVTYSSAPATEPSITTQPQNATYIIGSTDYPSMSVAATASKGELKYQWHVVLGSQDIAIPGATTNSLSLADYKDMMAAYLASPAEYDIYCVVTDDNASVNTNTAKIIVKEAAVPGTLSSISESTTWNFSSITWDGVTYKNANDDFEFTGENVTTEWVYSNIEGLTFASDFNADALAFTGQYPIRSNSKKLAQNGTLHFNTTVAGTIKVSFSDTGSKIPEGGAIERYLNVNGSNTEFYTKRDGTSDSKTVEVNVPAGDVYITGMDADGKTPQAICITSIVFTVSEEPAPATEPSITTQPQNATYIIGSTDYPSMSVAATASKGELKYQWHVVLGSQDIAIPGATTNSLSLADYKDMMAAYLASPAEYDIYCVVTDDNASVNTNTAKITVEAAEPVGGITITEEPSDVTYTIGDTDYPSVSVEATASEGTITYDWKFSLNGNDFTSLTTMGITSASTNTLSGEEVFVALGNMIPDGQIPTGTYYLRCTLTNGDYSVETNTATITVNKPAELTPVSASTTWDFADVTWDDTTNKNDKGDYELVGDDRTTEYAYKDVSGLTFANTFNANAIAFKGQYPIRSNSKKHAQNGVVRIATSCPGTIKVSFTDTGTKATTDAVKRYLVVNGEQTEYWTSRGNNGAEPYDAQLNVTTGEINVVAGNITIEGTSAICVSKIVFTANATAINGIAEDAEASDAANVKVIKNGKLYIGKYNVAGQRVK